MLTRFRVKNSLTFHWKCDMMLWVRFHFTHGLELTCNLMLSILHVFLCPLTISGSGTSSKTASSQLYTRYHTHSLSICHEWILLPTSLQSAWRVCCESAKQQGAVLNKARSHRGLWDKNRPAHCPKFASKNKLGVITVPQLCIKKHAHMYWSHVLLPTWQQLLTSFSSGLNLVSRSY